MQKMPNEKTRSKLSLLNNKQEINYSGTYSIFLRHADRYKIPEGEFGNDIELNEMGFSRSVEFGKSISALKINRIFTSPVKRCIQTAEHIRKGLGKNIPIEITKILGDPGAFVEDDKLAAESFLSHGFEYCYESLLSQLPLPGNRNIIEGAEILTDFIEKSSENEGVNVFISHDMIVALYAYAAFKRKYELGENWVKYIDGLYIKHE
ncbi:MAG: histidine phosphatase family protein [Bacteroidales bacterium]|nr:histidine phosphatase family protein [Bacteroidales bacterium]